MLLTQLTGKQLQRILALGAAGCFLLMLLCERGRGESEDGFCAPELAVRILTQVLRSKGQGCVALN